MIVIAKDTEHKFLKELNRCRREQPHQRCFYMAFSRADLPKDHLFEQFLRLLHEVPESYSAQVYICHDLDVFILMQGFMQRQFSKFLNDLALVMDTADLERYAEIMEVGIHGDKLDTICQKKLLALEEKNVQKGQIVLQEQSEGNILDALKGVSPEAMANIALQRDGRRAPLVMVADDDQVARSLVGNVIQRDYDYAFAEDGQQAISRYIETAPDVLFLDIGLPDMSGHDVLEVIFQIDPDAYIIMFSGYKDKGNILRALETGAHGFVGKPFTREKLLHYISKSPHLLSKLEKEKSYANTTRR